MITGINNVGIGVRDLDRSIAFYERLGFAVASRDETPGAFLQAENAYLYLFQTAAVSPTQVRGADLAANPVGIDHVSFDVPDVDAVYARLKDSLPFDIAPADQAWGYRMAGLTDPDGNRLYLLTPLAQGD